MMKKPKEGRKRREMKRGKKNKKNSAGMPILKKNKGETALTSVSLFQSGNFDRRPRPPVKKNLFHQSHLVFLSFWLLTKSCNNSSYSEPEA